MSQQFLQVWSLTRRVSRAKVAPIPRNRRERRRFTAACGLAEAEPGNGSIDRQVCLDLTGFGTAVATVFYAFALLAVSAHTKARETADVNPESTVTNIKMLYLEEYQERPPALSNIFPRPEDQGEQGAHLGVADSNTTGRFLRQRYDISVSRVADQTAALQSARSFVDEGLAFILANVSAETALLLARDSSISGKAVVFNVGSTEDQLRATQCTTGLLHTTPSRAMLADALAQFLIRRKWQKWLLLKGPQTADKAWVDALNRSAKRFGGKITDERTWSFNTDLRRTAQQELPLFTQARSYDVVLVADEIGDVGEYVSYNTWLPRPVAGTQGLVPVGWHRVLEQWGAKQLQNRFREQAGRTMNDVDYAAWVAVRAIAEAVTRSKSTQPAAVYRYLLSGDFELAAFKGRSLSFRSWNGQLRQPIPLVQPRAMVSQSPQEGFLHPQTELDTLGYDAQETNCSFETSL